MNKVVTHVDGVDVLFSPSAATKLSPSSVRKELIRDPYLIDELFSGKTQPLRGTEFIVKNIPQGILVFGIEDL